MKGCSMETERPSDKFLNDEFTFRQGDPIERREAWFTAVEAHPMTSPGSASGNHRVTFVKLSKVQMTEAQLEASLASQRASKP